MFSLIFHSEVTLINETPVHVYVYNPRRIRPFTDPFSDLTDLSASRFRPFISLNKLRISKDMQKPYHDMGVIASSNENSGNLRLKMIARSRSWALNTTESSLKSLHLHTETVDKRTKV